MRMDEHLVQGMSVSSRAVRWSPAERPGRSGGNRCAVRSLSDTGGWLIVGTWLAAGDAVRELFRKTDFAVETRRDYGGNDRVTLGQQGREMKSIADFEFNGAPLLSGIMLVLKLSVRILTVEKAEAHINELIRPDRKRLPPYSDEHACLQTLITLFYHKWQFSGASAAFIRCLTRCGWIMCCVLQCGSPVSLGILFLHIAQAIGLLVCWWFSRPSWILRADLDDETLFINPINGDLLDQYTLDVWIKGMVSPAHHLTAGMISKKPKTAMWCAKYLDSIKVALMEEKKWSRH